MHWKIARDPYYAPLCARYGEALVREAGFFDDTATQDALLDDVTTLCTPAPAVPPGTIRPAVLLCTGSFSPIHAGHLAMMAAARRAVEAAGHTVVGGYLSPGHDEYITLKLGPDALSASTRLDLCARAVAGFDWLMVDPWEALHRQVAVNFTDVVARLTAYLHHHVRPDVAVFYVCGGDNARFALTFAMQGRCVVVSRPGNEAAVTRYRSHPLLADPERFLWADAGHTGSSTRARQGDHSVLPAAVQATLDRPRPTALTLRAEDASVAWGRTTAFEAFQEGLEALLSRWLSVEVVRLADQRIPATRHPIISLDPLLPAAHSVAISRLFDLGGLTRRGHVTRPDTTTAPIPPGTYALFDDDICTGGTMKAARSRLPPGVMVAETLSLQTAGPPDARREIADSRDFLLGTTAGGLVVTNPDGTLGRAPYALPAVNPLARCSVPAVHAFSRAVWQLNVDFFAGSGLTVADLPPAAARHVRCAGFSADVLLETVCRWNRDQYPPPRIT